MKHRIALEIDGNLVTITVDDTSHSFMLGDKPKKKSSKARPATVSAPRQAKGTKPGRAAAPTKAVAPKKSVPRRVASTAKSTATTAEIRAWAVSTGKYPDLSARGPLPKSLREDYAAARRK